MTSRGERREVSHSFTMGKERPYLLIVTLTAEKSFEAEDAPASKKRHMNVNERVRAKLQHIEYLRQKANQSQELLRLRFEKFRSYLLIIWVCSSGLFVSIVTQLHDGEYATDVSKWFLRTVFGAVVVLNGVRFLGSVFYLLLHHCHRSPKPPKYPKARSQLTSVHLQAK